MAAFIARSEARQRYIRLRALERRLLEEERALRWANSHAILPFSTSAAKGKVELGSRATSLSLPGDLNCTRLLCPFGKVPSGKTFT